MKMRLKAKMTSTCSFGMNGVQATQEVQTITALIPSRESVLRHPRLHKNAPFYRIVILPILTKAHLQTQPNAY